MMSAQSSLVVRNGAQAGVAELAGAELAAAVLVVAFRAAAAGRAAAAHQGAGDGVHAGGSRSHLHCHPRSGAAYFRTNRLRSRAFIVGLSPYPPPLGECPGVVSSMAAHLSHAMERPADFFGADCAFSSGRGVGLLVDAATTRARSTPS